MIMLSYNWRDFCIIICQPNVALFWIFNSISIRWIKAFIKALLMTDVFEYVLSNFWANSVMWVFLDLNQWNPESESRAVPLLTLNGEIPSKSHSNILANSKPKSDTVTVEAPILSNLGEWSEELVDIFFRYANTRILHSDIQHVGEIVNFTRNLHEPALGVLNCIWKKVNQNLLDTIRISLQLHG